MRSRSVVFGLLLALAALLLLAARPALAESQVRAVRLSFVEGTVQLDRGDGNGLGTAFMNMPVSQGTRLATGDDGRAEVQLEDGSAIRLLPNTSIYFSKLSLQDSGAKNNVVNVEKGTAYFDAHKHDKDVFLVAAGQQEITLQRSSRFRLVQNSAPSNDQNPQSASEMDLAVITGAVEVSGGQDRSEPITVKKGETYKFDPADATKYYLAKEIDSSPYDDWNHDREQYLDQYAYNSSNQSYSPYQYGLSDLSYYGNFVTVGGYGPLWRPAYVNPVWSPFANGAWAYYPGWGYSWVSAYPWGWLPYHYGNWVFVPSYGWCWQPGNAWNQWQPINPVLNPPSGFRPPQPPIRGHGGVVPVGRGPATIFPPDRREPGSGPINPNLRRLQVDSAGTGVGRGANAANSAQVGNGTRTTAASGQTVQNSGGVKVSPPIRVEPTMREPGNRTDSNGGFPQRSPQTAPRTPSPRRSTPSSPSTPRSMGMSAPSMGRGMPSMGHTFGGFSHGMGSSMGSVAGGAHSGRH